MHNGTIEIVDGNISLNILNGEVLSYVDSFYRGPLPDLTASDTPFQFADFNSYPVPVGMSQYDLQSYCVTTSEVARKQWMRENPKWSNGLTDFIKAGRTGTGSTRIKKMPRRHREPWRNASKSILPLQRRPHGFEELGSGSGWNS